MPFATVAFIQSRQMIGRNKMFPLKCFVFFYLSALCCHCLKFPEFVKRCGLKDPTFDECATKNANDALSHIIPHGIPKLEIPPFTPLIIPNIYLPSKSLTVNLTDCKLSGFESATVKSMHFDFDRKKISANIFAGKLNLLSHYKIDGQLLILAIRGEGPANYTFVGADCQYEMEYELIKKKNGDYMNIIKHNLEFVNERNYFKMDNLFNGDKALGENLNKFLDESWKEVTEELYPSLKEAISQIITTILSRMLAKIPAKDFLLTQ